MLVWLERNQHLATWLQALGVVAAVVFGLHQLRDARLAIQTTVDSNRIALRNQASDILFGINQAALALPEDKSGMAAEERLHLMRLHYFLRVHELHSVGVLDDERFAAERLYLLWTARQAGFDAVWSTFHEQFPPRFRRWCESVLAERKG